MRPNFPDLQQAICAAEQSLQEIKLLKNLAKKHGYKVKRKKFKFNWEK